MSKLKEKGDKIFIPGQLVRVFDHYGEHTETLVGRYIGWSVVHEAHMVNVQSKVITHNLYFDDDIESMYAYL